MNLVVIYKIKIPPRVSFTIELITGSLLVILFINLFINQIYPGILSFAGPMLGIAFLIRGLSKSKIEKINLNQKNNSLEIKRVSLFKVRISQIETKNLKVELKSTDNKKNSLIPKIKLSIKECEKEIEKIESGFLSMNNDKIEKLYKDLKAIVKNANTN